MTAVLDALLGMYDGDKDQMLSKNVSLLPSVSSLQLQCCNRKILQEVEELLKVLDDLEKQYEDEFNEERKDVRCFMTMITNVLHIQVEF